MIEKIAKLKGKKEREKEEKRIHIHSDLSEKRRHLQCEQASPASGINFILGNRITRASFET